MKLFRFVFLFFACIAFLSFSIFNNKEKPNKSLSDISAQVFFPLEIKDEAAASGNSGHTMIMMTGKTLKTAVDCGLEFTLTNGAYVGKLVPLTASSTPDDFTIQLDTMHGYASDSTVMFLIPQLQSGRATVSINSPLCLHTNPDGTNFPFQDPSINNPTDPNYELIYDKFEFTYDKNKNFFINPTAVDFFSIPIHINTLDNSQHSGAPTGMTRAQMMTSIERTIKKLDNTSNNLWNKCIIQDATTNTLIRIASPSLAPGFDTTYLSNSSRGGFNYINNLISYYKNKSLVIDCRPLDAPGMEIFNKYGVTPTDDPGAYYFTGTIGNSSPPLFTFVNSPKSTTGSKMTYSIKMDSVRSMDFFKPGTGQFSTPNKSLESILVENIVSGFSVGLLPAPDGDTFSNKIFPKEILSYFKSNPLNTPASQSKGPWYNLYSQAVHNSLGNSIYAFAYDDVLGMDGTISTTNADTIRVTIQDMGNIVLPSGGCEPAVIPVDISSIVVNKVKCNTDTCTMTVSWNVPSGQPRNAKYFMMISPASAMIQDSVVMLQLQSSNLTSFKDHSTTICFDKSSWLGRGSGSNLEVQVFTCGDRNSPCPTVNNIALWRKGLGIGPVKQTIPSVDPLGCTN